MQVQQEILESRMKNLIGHDDLIIQTTNSLNVQDTLQKENTNLKIELKELKCKVAAMKAKYEEVVQKRETI